MELAKERRGHFLYRLFCPKEFFQQLCFISMYSVLNTLSEYKCFYISKNTISYTFFLVFKIFESLQCILKILLFQQKSFTINCIRKNSHHKKLQFKQNKTQNEANTFLLENKKMILLNWLKCGTLRDLVPFVQFKKREKHPWRSVNFSKVAGFKP